MGIDQYKHMSWLLNPGQIPGHDVQEFSFEFTSFFTILYRIIDLCIMENYLGYSKAEMISDYNSDFYNSLVKKTKAAKYKLDSKKTGDIQNAILEQMRLERHTRTVFEDDDCEWFFRLKGADSVITKTLYEVLDRENIKFVNFFFEFLTKHASKPRFSAKPENGTMLDLYKKLSSLAPNDRRYFASTSEIYSAKRYWMIEEYVKSHSEECIAAAAENDKIITTILDVLVEQMKDYRENYIVRVTDFFTKKYKLFPSVLEDTVRQIANVETELLKRKNELKGESFSVRYHDVTARNLTKTIDKLRDKKERIRSIIRTYSEAEYVDKEVTNAINQFDADVRELANRIKDKGFNIDTMTISRIHEDPKLFEMHITDGTKHMYARSIIAAEFSEKVRAHYRFIITDRKE